MYKSSDSTIKCVRDFTVVIAVDPSPQAEYAVNYYFENIHREGNKVLILQVIELPDMAHARQSYLSPTGLAEMWAEEQEKSTKLQSHLLQICKKYGVVDAKAKSEGGTKPGHQIVSSASELSASLIVIGTRGMGKLRRTVLGSVSDYVVHHSACPVIVVRHISDADTE